MIRAGNNKIHQFFSWRHVSRVPSDPSELIAWVKAIQHLSVWGVTTKRVMGRYSKPRPGMARDEMMRWWDVRFVRFVRFHQDASQKSPTATSRQKPSAAITSLPTIFYHLFKETTRKNRNDMKWNEMNLFSTRKHETQPKRPWGNWVFSNETMTLPPDSPGNNKKTRGSTRQKDKIQSNTKSKYIVFLVKKEMNAILFQMPIMPIMTFAPSYWCIRSANPFGRQKCPGSQLLHLEALGQEIGSQVSKIWGSMRIKGDSQKNSKNSKDQRSPSPWRPGSSSRKLCRWRKANNSSAARWKRTVTPVSPSTRPTDLRLSTAPRAARCNSLSRHIEHLFHWKHLHRCTVTMPNLLYHAVPSYHVWLHHFFTGSHYIHIYSHMITYDHMNEKRFGSMASVKYVPAPHSKAPHTSIYILYKYGPYLAWVAKSSASDDGVPES